MFTDSCCPAPRDLGATLVLSLSPSPPHAQGGTGRCGSGADGGSSGSQARPRAASDNAPARRAWLGIGSGSALYRALISGCMMGEAAEYHNASQATVGESLPHGGGAWKATSG